MLINLFLSKSFIKNILNNYTPCLLVKWEYKLGGKVSQSGFVIFSYCKESHFKNAGDAISYLTLGELYYRSRPTLFLDQTVVIPKKQPNF